MYVYPAASAAWTFWNRARLASVSLINAAAAMTCAAVGGAVVPYILMSGRPSVDPMSPMPGMDDAADAGDPDAVRASPSGPAQPGVITAAVTATTRAGNAATVAAVARGPRRCTGWSARDGRHSSAAHPAINAASRITLTTSRAPGGSGWCRSGPNGRPTVRDATYTATIAAFPAMPSPSHHRDGRHSRTAGQTSWAQEMTRKKTPYGTYTPKCANVTAKWIAAAPTDSAARPPRTYGRAVAGAGLTFSSARTEELIPRMLGSAAGHGHRAGE